ncbi:MAG: S1 family peptidase [Candidatus Latescibacterota bacterium]
MTWLKLLLISTLFIACGSDGDNPVSWDEEDVLDEAEEDVTSAVYTFGIRHDRTLAQYEAVARNVAPYNTADYPDFAPVVAFSYGSEAEDTGEYVATGTLISPHWILTAGHNFFSSDEQEQPTQPTGITVLLGADPNTTPSVHSVAELVFYPSWIEQDELMYSANDLCLVRLAEPITSVEPAVVNTSLDEPIGSVSWFCGFGDYSEQEGQDPDALSKRHALQNTLDRKVDGISSRSGGVEYFGGLLAFDFDAPDGTINSLGDGLVNEDEALLGPGNSGAQALPFEGATVEGDSGGPLFVRINGVWTLAGVLSGGATDPIENHRDSSYGDISIFIRVATHAEWILSVTGLRSPS